VPSARIEGSRRRRSARLQAAGRDGFTLVELLVVIAIVGILAGLSFAAATRVSYGIKKARSVAQMRGVGQGVIVWAADNNGGEPMYFRDGNGDSSSEATPAPSASNRGVCAGNPAMLLFNRTNLAMSYVSDHKVFFSPLHNYTVPSRAEYDPSQAGTSIPGTTQKRIWGTYIWVFPSVPSTERTQRQLEAMRDSAYTAVSEEAYNKALMFDDYSAAKAVSKTTYLALFRDGSVREVAKDGNIWGWFFGSPR
jgi:prepilin-type N-terminal cleavage/methylation domain-containing protein